MFDPFPFSFLTMVVSLEAIFLAIFVLISQNRMARLADHRAHLDLQVNLRAEQEITTTLKLVQEMRAHSAWPLNGAMRTSNTSSSRQMCNSCRPNSLSDSLTNRGLADPGHWHEGV